MKLCIIVLFLILSSFKTFSLKLDIKTYEKIEVVKTNVIEKYELLELALFIKSHEGLRLKPYYCPGNIQTIGYGHSILKNESYLLKGITKSQADSILLNDISKCKNFVINLFKKQNLNNNKITALTHFTYSIGGGNLLKSTLYKKIISNDSIQLDIIKWCKIGKKSNNQLIKQRKWELNIFYEKTT